MLVRAKHPTSTVHLISSTSHHASALHQPHCSAVHSKSVTVNVKQNASPEELDEKFQDQRPKSRTRHRASTSMYSLRFRVRVTTPPQYGRNGTAHAADTSILSLARGVFASMRSVRVRRACGVRWAWRVTAGFCHAFISTVLP